MARQQKVEVQNKFTRGLVTEATGLTFPTDACTETWNCVFDETGRVSVRPGIDIEDNYFNWSAVRETNSAWTEYVWPSVGGDGNKTFLVQQKGSVIYFYDISSEVAEVGEDRKSFFIDLTLYVPSGSSLSPISYPCSYAHGDGNLLIVNYAIDPIVVDYTATTDSILVTQTSIKIRDFVGLDSGLAANTTRPSYSVATLKTGNPNHYYNLLNQGWHSGDALTQWDSARTDMPSNADMVPMYRASLTDAFDNAILTGKSPGNMKAPSGHFLLSPFAPNRTAAMVAEGFTGASVGSTEVTTTYVGSTTISSGVTNVANLFDGDVNTVTGSAPTGSYAGKTLAAATTISRAKLSKITSSAPVTFFLYGKSGAAPASATDGTYLGAMAVATGTTTELSINSSDITTSYNHYWIRWQAASGVTANVGELTLYHIDLSGSEIPTTYSRPTTTAFYAGRAWYAGCDGLGLNNTVFFSQIIESKDQFDKCYQLNDPTSEDYPQLLASDGGSIKIPEAATIIHIGQYANGLLVFATNGVWVITGSNRQYFTANAFGIRKISSIGTASGLSFVDYRGLPVWWGESGIYTVRHDPNYDAYTVESLTDATIYGFIASIPNYNRTFVKGAYNADTETITWLYNSDASLAVADRFSYDRILQFNALSKSFYPHKIMTDALVPVVRGILNCKPAREVGASRIKFMVSQDVSTSEHMWYAEFRSGEYKDWTKFVTSEGNGLVYTPYFITGYAIDGSTQNFWQSNYIFIFLEPKTNSSCEVRALFDWTNSSSSGKWSSGQEIYNDAVLYRDLRFRRLKLRGKGRSVQLKFTGTGGRPFNIVGWSVWKTGNAQL